LDPPEASARLFRHRRDGARADAISIWIAQFVGQKINVLDYYEAQGQPLSVHIDWMSSRGWGTAWVILPHDGAYGDKVFATSYESAIREAGFDVLVVPNQGAGAAKARIETPRRHFPRIFFNAETTEPGRDALGWYHEKRSNDDRNIGLGPNHDWSSRGADGLGLMCIHYDQPEGAPPPRERCSSRRTSSGGGACDPHPAQYRPTFRIRTLHSPIWRDGSASQRRRNQHPDIGFRGDIRLGRYIEDIRDLSASAFQLVST
jgi:phage terminase large subunit